MTRCVYCKKAANFAKGISIHRFPIEDTEKQQWIQNMGWTNWTPAASSVICSNHFEANCIDRRDKLFRRRKGSVPTLFGETSVDCVPDLPKFKISSDNLAVAAALPDLVKENQTIQKPSWIPSLADQIRAFGHDHTYAISSESKERQLRKAEEKILRLLKKNDVLTKKEKRKRTSVGKLKNKIKQLRSKNVCFKQKLSSHNNR